MKRILLGLSVIVLAGCVAPTPAEKPSEVETIQLTPSQLATVKSVVRSNMKDPDSAQFGDYIAFRATDDNGRHDVVCGYVNGKNSYGGYVGMTPYIAISSEAGGNFVAAVGPDELHMQVCQKQYGVSI